MPKTSSVPLNTPIGPLLLVVFESILEVFLLCVAGYVLAQRGILDKKTQKQLNRVNVSIFTPSLLFSKVAFFLTPAKLKELWIIPFFFLIITAVSMGVAYVLSHMFRLKRSQRAFAMAAAMFMNSNSLPIALMQSLVITVPGLKWEADDNKSSMIGRALTYLVLHSTLGMVLRWSYGVRLLAQADSEIALPPDSQEAETEPLLGRDETAFPIAPVEDRMHHHQRPQIPAHPHSHHLTHAQANNHSSTSLLSVSSISGPSSGGVTPREVDADADPERAAQEAELRRTLPTILVRGPTSTQVPHARPGMSRKGTGVFYSFPNSPSHMARDSPARSDSDVSVPTPLVLDQPDDEDLAQSPNRAPHTGLIADGRDEHGNGDIPDRREPPPSTSSRPADHRYLHRVKRRLSEFWRGFNDFMTVPLWAAFLSLIVALIRPLQHGLEDHFPPVKNALTAAGQCSIPVTLIVLGAYFYVPPEEGLPDAAPSGGKKSKSKSNDMKRKSAMSLVGSVRSMLMLGTLRGKDVGDEEQGVGRLESPSFANLLQVNEKAPGETKTVFVAVISRMVVTPLLLLPGMALSAKFDWHQVLEDPVFVVSNVLLIASPPALTLAQITQAASGDQFERLISRTVFWSYCVVTPPSTIIFVVIGLLLSKL